MPMVVRVLFPVLAAFGPLFMVLGLRTPQGGAGLADAGALMTSAALILVFVVLARVCGRGDPGRRS